MSDTYYSAIKSFGNQELNLLMRQQFFSAG